MTLVVTAALCACGGGKGDESSAESKNSSETTTTEAESTAQGTAVKGGEVTVGIAQDLDSLDPQKWCMQELRKFYSMSLKAL